MVHTLSYIATLNATSFITGMRSMMTSVTSVGSGVTSLTGKISNLVMTLAKIGAVLGIAAIGGVTIAMGKATQAAIAWEASMANVAKTTGLEGQELEDLGNEFLDLSTKISTSKEELASMGAVAGQLGIAKEDIGAFTETISKMSVAFDMTGEEAATSMAQIQNIWEKPVAEAEKFGSALNYLGNNTAASEKQLIAYMQNVGNSPKVLGLTQQETLAFGDILVAMGMDASDAGTRLNSAFSGRGLLGNLGAAAELAGMTENQFKQILDTDPTSAIVSVVDAISNVESNIKKVSLANEIFGVTGGKAIMPLIGQTDLLRQRIDEVNKAYDEGTSLQEEFAAKENTTAAIIQRIKNTWSALLVDIGKNVNKSKTFQGILQKIHEWLLKAREIVQNFSIEKFKEQLAETIPHFELLKEIGEDYIDTLSEIWEALKSGDIKGILTEWSGFFKDTAEKIIDEFSDVPGKIKDKLINYDWAGTGKQIFTLFKNGIIAAVSEISEFLDSLKNKIIGYDWENVGKQTAQLLKDAMHYAWLGLLALWDIGGQIWNWIKESLGKSEDTSWFNVISDAFWKFWDGFKTELIGDQTWGEALKSVIMAGYDKTIEVSKKWYHTIADFFKGVLAVILGHLDIWTIDFINLWIYAINGALDTIYNFSDWATEGFNTVYEKIKPAIDSIIGLVDSLTSKLSAITDIDLSSIGDALGYNKKYYEIETSRGNYLKEGYFTDAEIEQFKSEGYRAYPTKPPKTIVQTVISEPVNDIVETTTGNTALANAAETTVSDAIPTTPLEVGTSVGKLATFGVPGILAKGAVDLYSNYKKEQIEGQTPGFSAVWPGNWITTTSENQDVSSYFGEAEGTIYRPGGRNYISPVGYLGGDRDTALEMSIQGYKDLFGLTEEIATDEWDSYKKQQELLSESNKIEKEGTTQVTNSIDDMRNTLIANNTDVASTLDKIEDATKSTSDNIAEVAEAVTKEPVTGYFDPSNMGPDDFRNKVESMGNMFAESIVAPSDVYVDRIIEKLQNAEYVHPAQLNMAAKLSDSSVEDLVAQIEAEKPTMTPEIESSTAIDQATTLDTDISTMIPEMEVSLLTTNALLDAQSLFASIERMNPHMQVSVDVSANAGQIANIARAAVRDAIASAYSE